MKRGDHMARTGERVYLLPRLIIETGQPAGAVRALEEILTGVEPGSAWRGW